MAAVLVVLAGLTAALVLADAPVRAQQQSSREGRIVFLFGESSVPRPSQIGVRDADGRNARPLKPYSVYGVSWSPDGRSIAFGTQGTGVGGVPPGISTMNIDGRPRQRRVIRNGSDPDWSPNGRAIAFDRYRDHRPHLSLWVLNPSDRRQRRIVRFGSYPDWSPDGKKLVFTRGSDIWVVEVSSKKQRLFARHGHDPRWSPDGKQIAFERCGMAACFVDVMRSDGTKLRRLFEGESPAWSPTGREIAFWDEDPKHGITRARLDGSHRRRLPAGPFPPIYCPCWAIDWGRTPHARR